MTNFVVRCTRQGELVAVYEFPEPEPMDAFTPALREDLVSKAQSLLTDQRLAVPPYAGIEFEILIKRR